MKNIAIIAISFATAAALTTPVFSQARTNITSLSCNQAKALIDKKGAAVVTTGARTYDRYVKNRNFCSIGDQLRRQNVKTKDSNSCFIGYVCAPPRSRGN